MKRQIRIGTRGSQLALWQADHIEKLLKSKSDDLVLKQIIIKTGGDRDQISSLTKIGGVGIFTKAIEDALLDNKIDIAVHSLKDLPSGNKEGLILAAVPERGPVEDVLITASGTTLKQLKLGAVIASGSIRRRSQLLRLRPDLKMTDLRGNIDTRIKKLYNQNLDGIIMARAALQRLKMTDLKYHLFPVHEMIPSVGQGAIGVQIRSNDKEIAELVSEINHNSTYHAVSAERAFLYKLDSGCQFPVGAYAQIKNDICELNGFVGSEDGKKIIRHEILGDTAESEYLGHKLALEFIEKGALEILKEYNEL